MSNLDRIWKLYMAFKKTESKKEFDYSSWDYYREGYCEAETQRAALDARRAETLKKYKERTQEAQPALASEQKVDWEKLYRLEVKKKEAIAAKYERDIKPLNKIVPMAQPEQKRPPNCGTGYCSCIECVMEDL